LVWLPSSLDEAVNVAASLLVITCPCAIGIAIPLAYELTQTHLRRSGLYVRSADLLDRLTRVKKVVFDKTGTLTLGRLELETPATAMSEELCTVAWNLAVRSAHPVSGAIARGLEARGGTYDPRAQIEEVPGHGMEWRRSDGVWRLGRAAWATPGTAAVGSVLSRDGHLVARFVTREALRPDARRELQALEAQGFEVWLMSGDGRAKVTRLAEELGLHPQRALAELRPEDKATAVRALDAEDTLYLGDGVNDALAFEAAAIAGTPAIDRPVMPSRSDFFLVGEGLSAIKEALARSTHLRATVRRVLSVSLTYNVFAIALALLGKMTPLVAAITMPASTLTLIGLTVVNLRAARSASAAHDQMVTQSPRVAEARP
jgi:Cu2+-exporting ATPase